MEPKPTFSPLPPTINRTFNKTPSGDIDSLVSAPGLGSGFPAGCKKTLFLFVHGGFGNAPVWLPWMTYLHRKQYSGKIYAVSIRATVVHGLQDSGECMQHH